MATNVSDYKELYGTFSNDQEWVKATYNYAVEGGATGVYHLFKAKEDLVVLNYYADVQTAIASGTSLSIGIDGSTEFNATKAATAFTLDALIAMDTYLPKKVASGSYLDFQIVTSAVSAGKIVFNFLVKKM